MKRWALMQGAVCANVVEQDEMPQIGGTWQEVTGLAVGPGHKWSGSAWVAPRTIAQQITSRQGKRALLAAGLYNNALAAINALPEPTKTGALIDWDAPSWNRDDPTLLAMATGLGLSEAQLDDLFAQAATL